jgi:hypothetical protein
MAMGLGFLGRGRGRIYTIWVSTLHIAGAILGGALVGGLVGAAGMLLSLDKFRWETIFIATVVALWYSIGPSAASLGLKRQVPRSWERTLTPPARFFFWGMLLGSGVATIIPHATFLVLLAVQSTSGVLLGAVSGAVFGASRQIMAILILFPQTYRNTPEMIGLLLHRHSSAFSRASVLCTLVAAAVFIVLSLAR